MGFSAIAERFFRPNILNIYLSGHISLDMKSLLPKFDNPFAASTEKYLELTRYLQSAEPSVMTESRLEKFLSGIGAGINASATGRAFFGSRVFRFMEINSWNGWD